MTETTEEAGDAAFRRRKAAVWGLAEELVWKINQLDPGALPDWLDMDERTRRFYYHVAKHLTLQHSLLREAVVEG